MPLTLVEAIRELDRLIGDIVSVTARVTPLAGITERFEAQDLGVQAFRQIQQVRRLIVTEAFDQEEIVVRTAIPVRGPLPTDGEASPVRMRDTL